MKDAYNSIERCNPGKEIKVLAVFHEMIDDIISNKKLHPVATELFIKGRKLNISLLFITQSYFQVPKDVILKKIIMLFYHEDFKQTRTSKIAVIAHLILALTNLSGFTEIVQQNHFHFRSLIPLFHQIIHYVFERIC